MKKLISLILAITTAFTLLPGLGQYAAAAGSWADTGAYDTSWYKSGEPYRLSDAGDLAGLAVLVNGGESFSGKSLELTANINLAGRIWVPIGTGESSKKHFGGSFDGGGFHISGMNVGVGNVCSGLFGYAEGIVKNTSLDSSCSVTAGGTNGGSIAGVCDGSILNCASEAELHGSLSGSNANFGGIVGYLSTSGSIYDTSFNGTVIAEGYSRKNVGGIVGFNKGEVVRCMSSGSVTVRGSGEMSNAGGITGFDNGSTTKNCYNWGNVYAADGNENNAGGVVGRLSASPGLLQNCYSTGKVSAVGTEANMGGVIGKKITGTVN